MYNYNCVTQTWECRHFEIEGLCFSFVTFEMSVMIITPCIKQECPFPHSEGWFIVLNCKL